MGRIREGISTEVVLNLGALSGRGEWESSREMKQCVGKARGELEPSSLEESGS